MKNERTIRKYALQKNGEERLELSIGRGYKNLHVYLDGKLIDNGIRKFALLEGETVYLPDGDLLYLKLQTGSSFSGLMMLFNGQPVPNSLTDPDMMDKQVALFQYLSACLLLPISLLMFKTDFEHHLFSYAGDMLTALGFLFILVGMFYKKNKKTAIIISFVLQVLSLIYLPAVMIFVYLNIMIQFVILLNHIRKVNSIKTIPTQI